MRGRGGGGGLVPVLAVDGGEVNVNDFSGVGIDNGDEVQWVGVEVVMFRKAGKQETLLEAHFGGEPLVISNGPAVAADLLGKNADVFSELLDTLILSDNEFAVDQLFHRYLRLSTLGEKIRRVNHPFPISPGQDEIIRVACD